MPSLQSPLGVGRLSEPLAEPQGRKGVPFAEKTIPVGAHRFPVMLPTEVEDSRVSMYVFLCVCVCEEVHIGLGEEATQGDSGN